MSCLLSLIVLVVGFAPAKASEGIIVGAYYFPGWHKTAASLGLPDRWATLRQAVPRFPGHRQPRTPLWGEQDESRPEVMAQKIDAAAKAGIDAFIFDFYWHDRGVLKGPFLEEALDRGFLAAPNRAKLRFALMWANHQNLNSPGPIGRAGFEQMVRKMIDAYFQKENYLRIDGRNVFMIYNIDAFVKGLGGINQAADAMNWFRAATERSGAKGVFLVADIDAWVASHRLSGKAAWLAALGVDAVSDYGWNAGGELPSQQMEEYRAVEQRYMAFWDRTQGRLAMPFFPVVASGWDPTPRLNKSKPFTGRGVYPDRCVLVDNTPAHFKSALEDARTRALSLPQGKRAVFLYAWNEWDEGGYLEPDTMTGLEYLNGVQSVFGKSAPQK